MQTFRGLYFCVQGVLLVTLVISACIQNLVCPVFFSSSFPHLKKHRVKSLETVLFMLSDF